MQNFNAWNRPFAATALLLVGLGASLPAAHADETLDSSIQSALKKFESVAQQDEQVIQAKERESQATGAILPNVSAVGSVFRQQEDTSRPGTAISPTYQPLIKLTATQPLFRGFREFAGMRQTARLTDAQVAARDLAVAQLRDSVTSAYFAVLATERDLANLTSESELFRKRIGELNGRAKIGRSRASESLVVEASLSALDAQREQARGTLLTARENFAYLTGLSRDSKLVDLPEPTAQAPTPPAGEPLEALLKRIENRPDVRVARGRAEATDEAVSVAKGAHLPSADLTGNYYFRRTGVNENVDWDVQLLATLPLYAGGTIQSKVRETASLLRENELELARARRAADQEIRSIVATLQSERAQIDALTKAKDQANRNLQAQTRDYRLGLVTNIDVLQAMITFQETERSFDRARYSLRIDQARLLTATGQ